jgi:hypothetical protein
MAANDDAISPLCEEGDHADCGHEFATAWLPFRGSRAVLCLCDCHTGCPVAGRREVPEDVWFAKCICPGSDGRRDAKHRTAAIIDEQRDRQHEVMQGIELGRGKSDVEIKTLILDAYAARGWEPPSDLAWVSRFIAAATARRRRGVRLALESGRAIRAARNWLREPANRADGAEDD